MYSISQLASLCQVSRGTLLHYDSIGLLVPQQRSAAGYRLYNEADKSRLQQILSYRAAGLALADIQHLLQPQNAGCSQILQQQLSWLNQQINALQQQQRVLLSMLQSPVLQQQAGVMDKQSWVALLAASGLNEQDMWRWHQQFEQRMPEAHQQFLLSLGISAEEVASIRQRSRS